MPKIHITYFVHGTTTNNEQKIATGWNPGELSALGIKQSIQLKAQVKASEFDAVFCSDLKRAVDSASLAFGSAIQDAHLRECNYGDWNGRKEEELGDKTLRIEMPFPNGESYRDVETRIRDFLNFLLNNYPDKHVAIVAHMAPQLALEVICNKKTWPQAFTEDWRLTKNWKPGWDYAFQG